MNLFEVKCEIIKRYGVEIGTKQIRKSLFKHCDWNEKEKISPAHFEKLIETLGINDDDCYDLLEQYKLIDVRNKGWITESDFLLVSHLLSI
jgi:hypothetical protein